MLALGGISLLYKTGSGATLSTTGVLLVMGSALSYAIYIVGVNRPRLKDIATLKLTFYILLFGMLLFLIRVDFGKSLRIVEDWYLWGNLLALAIFPTRHILPVHHAGDPVYRLYADCHPGSAGTSDCRILRSNHLR